MCYHDSSSVLWFGSMLFIICQYAHTLKCYTAGLLYNSQVGVIIQLKISIEISAPIEREDAN